MYCIILYCIVLHCIIFYCIVLYCIVLYYFALYCIILHCIVLYCFVLYCSSQERLKGTFYFMLLKEKNDVIFFFAVTGMSFAQVGSFMIASGGNQTLYIPDPLAVLWTGDKVPVARPPCGFTNELCVNEPLST